MPTDVPEATRDSPHEDDCPRYGLGLTDREVKNRDSKNMLKRDGASRRTLDDDRLRHHYRNIGRMSW